MENEKQMLPYYYLINVHSNNSSDSVSPLLCFDRGSEQDDSILQNASVSDNLTEGLLGSFGNLKRSLCNIDIKWKFVRLYFAALSTTPSVSKKYGNWKKCIDRIEDNIGITR